MAAKDAPEDKSAGGLVGLAIRFLGAAGFLMVVVGFPLLWIRFAKPYLRTDEFLETKCTVIRSQLDGEYPCAARCRGRTPDRCYRQLRYPCVTISVSYNITTTNNEVVPWKGSLYEDERTYVQFKMKGGKCFFGYNQKCLRRHKYLDKLKRASRKLVAFGQEGMKYSCLYNPDKWNDVIKDRTLSRAGTFHAIFWPWFLLVSPVLVLILYCMASYALDGCASCFGSGVTTSSEEPGDATENELAMVAAFTTVRDYGGHDGPAQDIDVAAMKE